MARKIKVNIYDDVRQSLADALAYERGQKINLRVTEIPAPPKVLKPREIRHIRESLTQARPYSHTFSVSVQRLCRAGSKARDVRKARQYGS